MAAASRCWLSFNFRSVSACSSKALMSYLCFVLIVSGDEQASTAILFAFGVASSVEAGAGAEVGREVKRSGNASASESSESSSSSSEPLITSFLSLGFLTGGSDEENERSAEGGGSGEEESERRAEGGAGGGGDGDCGGGDDDGFSIWDCWGGLDGSSTFGLKKLVIKALLDMMNYEVALLLDWPSSFPVSRDNRDNRDNLKHRFERVPWRGAFSRRVYSIFRAFHLNYG